MAKIKCDRCGASMLNWQKKNKRYSDHAGGNCTMCGDDLCTDCAEEWTEDGICRRCVEDALTFYAKALNYVKENRLSFSDFMEKIAKNV